MSDEEKRRLWRLAGEGDLDAAERYVAILRRERLFLDLPDLDPKMCLVDVPHEKFGLSESWWGRCIRLAVWSSLGGDGYDPRERARATVADLASAMADEHAVAFMAGFRSGTVTRQKIETLLSKACLSIPAKPARVDSLERLVEQHLVRREPTDEDMERLADEL